MQKQILLVITAFIGVATLAGCSDSSHPTTPQELKSFKGGPMPPEFRKQFEAGQARAAREKAASAAKAKADAAVGKS